MKVIMTEQEFGSRKWEVAIDDNGNLWETYYEYFKELGWKRIGMAERISKEYFEEMYCVGFEEVIK